MPRVLLFSGEWSAKEKLEPEFRFEFDSNYEYIFLLYVFSDIYPASISLLCTLRGINSDCLEKIKPFIDRKLYKLTYLRRTSFLFSANRPKLRSKISATTAFSSTIMTLSTLRPPTLLRFWHLYITCQKPLQLPYCKSTQTIT